MPIKQRIQLYTQFIHRDFLINFRRLFRFRKTTFMMTEAENLIGESDHEKSEAKEEKPIYEKFKEYPYYDWND